MGSNCRVQGFFVCNHPYGKMGLKCDYYTSKNGNAVCDYYEHGMFCACEEVQTKIHEEHRLNQKIFLERYH